MVVPYMVSAADWCIHVINARFAAYYTCYLKMASKFSMTESLDLFFYLNKDYHIVTVDGSFHQQTEPISWGAVFWSSKYSAAFAVVGARDGLLNVEEAELGALAPSSFYCIYQKRKLSQ